MKKFIMGIGLWFMWFPLRKLLNSIPMKFNYSLAHFLSLLCYLFFKKRRNVVNEEVIKLFGIQTDKKKVKIIVKNSFSIFLKRQIENFLFGTFTQKQLNQIASIAGSENLEDALKKRKGVIILLSHFGSFLLPLILLGYRGYKVNQVAGEPLLEMNSHIHKKIFELRKKDTDKLPIQFIQSNRYLGPIVRALKKNEIIVIAFDGRTGNTWIPVQLLHRIAQFSPGPFNLAIKTGAPILPAFVVRGKDNKHRIIFEPAMELETTDDLEKALKINTIKYTGIFEKYLIDYPCHFAMTLYTIRREAESGLNRPLFVD
jgi:KDO2-lipid IV(A) lauroyltransferase